MGQARWIFLGMLLSTLGLSGCGGRTEPGDSGTDDGDGGGCPVDCRQNGDCCQGSCCSDGVCILGCLGCPTGCNWECDRDRGERCDQGTLTCIQGSPPLSCQSDCSCYAGEKCDQGSCVPACVGDENCASGTQCRDQVCRPRTCATNLDCQAEDVCLVCQGQECVAEPAVCVGNQDCCEGRKCNFGACVRIVYECQEDADCPSSIMWCQQGRCVELPECMIDADCSGCAVCLGHECVGSVGCTVASCPQGSWCQDRCTCVPGCDQNADCVAPETCNYTTHACGATDHCGNACTAEQYCEPFTWTCVPLCSEAPACESGEPPSCCPPYQICDSGTGRCACGEESCPAGSACDAQSGSCVSDRCEPPCDPFAECVLGECVHPGTGVDGEACLHDEDCDMAAGFLCDSWMFCPTCYFMDPLFYPEFVCREECSPLVGGCTNTQYECRYRHEGLRGLCVPPETP